VPAAYFLGNLAVAVALLGARPLECAIGLGLLAAGLPFYLAFARRGGALAPPGKVE
jgi:hypothetical protein